MQVKWRKPGFDAGWPRAVDWITDFERKIRETRLHQVTAISTNMILARVGEHGLEMPRRY